MSELTREQFRKWGAEGGKKSRRKLTRKQSLAMIAARERKRVRKPPYEVFEQ